MKRKLKKLQLNTETLRTLDSADGKNVAGGAPQTRAFTNCPYCIDTNGHPTCPL